MNLNDGSFQLEAAVAVLVSDSVDDASGVLFFKSLGDDSGFDAAKKQSYFQLLWDNVRALCREFEPFSFELGFGFDAYTVEQIAMYLCDPSQFSFRLNRKPGKTILYGVDHARLRRSILNNLPQELRLYLVRKKLDYFGVNQHLQELYQGMGLGDLVDSLDIGMGSSIYKLLFEKDGVSSELVLKKKSYQSQLFYCNVLRAIGWKTFDIRFFTNEFGEWEVSESLGDQNVNQYLMENESRLELEVSLARKAALGDLLGMGDRHFENYMIVDGHILSVDVTFLFWPDNESWTAKYIAGGLYEVTVLREYLSDLNMLKERWAHFFDQYRYYAELIASYYDTIVSEIQSFYGEDELESYVSFLNERIDNLASYISGQKQHYLDAFILMVERDQYKTLLQELMAKVPDQVMEDPLLKMYALSDKGRLSCFLHLEKHGVDILGRVREMGLRVLDLEPSFFDQLEDQCTHIRRLLSEPL